MSERIHDEIVLTSTPAQVYATLTDAARFSAMSGGAPAAIDTAGGGAFSLFGGMIEGRNIECVSGTRLVQAWRAKTWEPGVYSIARFELAPVPEGTRLSFDHTGFPDGERAHLAQGWKDNYWKPLQAALAAKG